MGKVSRLHNRIEPSTYCPVLGSQHCTRAVTYCNMWPSPPGTSLASLNYGTVRHWKVGFNLREEASPPKILYYLSMSVPRHRHMEVLEMWPKILYCVGVLYVCTLNNPLLPIPIKNIRIRIRLEDFVTNCKPRKLFISFRNTV